MLMFLGGLILQKNMDPDQTAPLGLILIASIKKTSLQWGESFRIIPEFRILRLTFHRKSASKYRIRQVILIAFMFYLGISKGNFKTI